LETKDARAAARAADAIDKKLALLATLPESGRIYAPDPRLRELMIEFGSSGYVALYHYEELRDRVFILAVRHKREVCY
jgi:plasmid stabilization system protein ParE